MSNHAASQTETRVGVMPMVNYNHSIDKLWDVNLRFESRHFVFENLPDQESNFVYDYSLSDFSAMIGRRTGLDSKIISGLLVRVEPEAVSYRTIQQFLFLTRIYTFRVVHRLSTDQTFSPIEDPEFRLRYRVNAEIPLSGQKLDPKEFYIKLNAEGLNSVQGGDYDLEVRLVPNIGYAINAQQKIELGLDNRLGSFINNQTTFTSWITINWYL
jgi:hypothetical protein